MTRRTKVLIVVLPGVLLASVFYLQILARRIFLDIPSPREEAVRATLSEAVLRSSTATNQSVTLYFPAIEKRRLAGEKRDLPLAADDTDKVHQILLALIEGPRLESNRALPPSTEVRAIFLSRDGAAFVDFSSDVLARLTPGIENETLTVYSVVNSLAVNIPSVKKVKILIQGQEVETLDGHADLSGYFVPDPALNLPPS